MEVKYILNTRSKKSIFFLSHRKVCKRPPPTSTFFQSTPLCKGRQRQTIYYHRTSVFNPHPHKGATSGDYLVNSRTAAVNRREIFAFWERFANDLHRPPPDCHKKVQKSPKNWEVEVVEVIFLLYAREEKSKKFFFYRKVCI